MSQTKFKVSNILFVLIVSVISVTHSFAENPIIPDQGVCDPHIHIFNNKAYLFASHDFAPTNTVVRPGELGDGIHIGPGRYLGRRPI